MSAPNVAVVFLKQTRSRSGHQYLAGMGAGFPQDEALELVKLGAARLRDEPKPEPVPHAASPVAVEPSSEVTVTIKAEGTVTPPPATDTPKGKRKGS